MSKCTLSPRPRKPLAANADLAEAVARVASVTGLDRSRCQQLIKDVCRDSEQAGELVTIDDAANYLIDMHELAEPAAA